MAETGAATNGNSTHRKAKGSQMDERKEFNKRAFVARVVLAVLAAAVSLSLAGCGKQMARIEENQLKVQALVELNAQQIGDVARRIEENQQALQNAIGNVRDSAQKLASDLASVAREHTKLQKLVQDNNLQMTDKIAMMEQRQQNLQAGIEDVRNGTVQVAADIVGLSDKQTRLEEMIEANSRTLVSKVQAMEQNQAKLQAEIKNVQVSTKQLAADLTAVAEARARLEEMVRSDRRQTDEKTAAIEQSQSSQQTEIETVKSNVLKVAASVDALEQNLLKLRETLQNDTRNLADIVQVIGQQQIEFEGKVERDIRGLAESMSAVEQNRAEFRKQIEDVQSNIQAMISNLTTALEQLKARVSQTGPLESTESAETAVSVSEVKKQD
jgi:predicted  nucleic acid-binding Zn-ribbon protein